MARILITFYQVPMLNEVENIICFYEGFVNTLRDCGNDVVILNTAFFSEKHDESFLISEVQKYDPDLILTFNNQIFESIYKITNCNIVMFDADGVEFFAYKELINVNKDRIKFVTGFEEFVSVYKNEFDLKHDDICVIPNATAVCAKNLIIDKNISFIGSFFNYDSLLDKHTNKKLYGEYLNFISGDKQTKLSRIDTYTAFDIRNIVLISLLDLGLNIYGLKKWKKFERYVPQMAYAFNEESIFSLKHNSDIYNSSKICLSISHAQTERKAFPWRCFDIMASNGCLVSSYSSELKNLTKGYVDIPMYNTHREAYDICEKLLKDEVWRKEIVASSQEYVQKNARWEHRFKILEKFVGIKLLNSNMEKGEIKFIKTPDENLKTPDENLKTPDENLKTVIFCCLKLILYAAIGKRKKLIKYFRNIEDALDT